MKKYSILAIMILGIAVLSGCGKHEFQTVDLDLQDDVVKLEEAIQTITDFKVKAEAMAEAADEELASRDAALRIHRQEIDDMAEGLAAADIILSGLREGLDEMTK